MSKKRIIAIISIIVLLFAAGISVGVFLHSRGETEAADGSQAQSTTAQNQVVDENQPTDGTQTGDNNENSTTNPNEDDENDENTETLDEGTVDGEENDETVENNNEAADNDAVNNNEVVDNDATNNNEVATNDDDNNENVEVTTDTNVDEVGETTITRVEEQERLISEDFWDWWQPMEVSVVPTNVGIEIPQMDVKKTAITGFGGDYLVERGHDITYVIAVTNNEDEATENIEITDRIPEKTTYIKDSIEDAYILKEVDGKVISETIETTKTTIGTGDVVTGVKWVVTIPANETVYVSFKVNVKETVLNENNEEVETTGSIYNKAIANGQESNEVETSILGIDVAKTATRVKRAGETEFTAPVGEVREGDVIEYTIVVTNTGSRDLTNVLLEEKLIDVEITELKVDGVSKALAFDEETGKLIIGDLKCAKEATEETDAVEAGVAVITAIYTVTYEADIKDKGNEDGSITPVYNEVYATGESVPDPKNPGEIPEEVEDNDDETVPVAEEPRFTITKTATRVKRTGATDYISTIGKVRPGDVVEYEIVITNTGNTMLTDILVTDTLSVRIDSDDGELKEVDSKTNVSTLKTIPSLVSGKSETILTYYTVKNTDVTTDEIPLYNVVTAKPVECEEKKDDENVPVNPNINIEGTKTWYAPDGYVVPDITIRLYEDGEPFKVGKTELSITLKDGATTYNFKGLPKYKFVDGIYELDKDGNYVINKYTVKEDDVEGFISSKDPNNEYNFINTIKQEKISINGTKTWDDSNDQDGIRPDSITIRLWADGVKLDIEPEISKEQDANGKWSYIFTDLDKYSSTGKEIKYTITEDRVTGYDEPQIDRYNIKNTHTPEKITVKGTKSWSGDSGKTRPTSITVRLLKNGEDTGKKAQVTASNNWSYSFDNLDRYENKTEIKYTVKEDDITNYVATYSKPTKPVNGIVTANISNTWRQDISGKIITVEETELPLDVVFVLDISSSMLETDGDSKTRVQDMVEATNKAIKELMKNSKNRVSVVLFNSDVYELTDANKLKHYNANSSGNYITYETVTDNKYVGGKISFANGESVNVSTSAYYDGAIKCGTYTQGGIKKAAQIFDSSKDSTTARKPVMILLTDGDPTHYDTKTTYNEDGTKYPGGDGIARLRYVTAEYYAYTMKTMQNCKTAITGFYNKECEMYTVGINMQGAMAKTLLEPSSTNINALEETKNISTEIHNSDDNGNQSSISVVDADGKWRSGSTYYKYQANRLKTLLKSNNTTMIVTSNYSNYINKAYTNSTSDKISENFDEIVNTITETKTINITAENYDSDRKIKLEGFNEANANKNNIFSLKIIQTAEDGSNKTIINTKDVTKIGEYIQGNSTDGYYLVLTNLLGKVNVELIYHK